MGNEERPTTRASIKRIVLLSVVLHALLFLRDAFQATTSYADLGEMEIQYDRVHSSAAFVFNDSATTPDMKTTRSQSPTSPFIPLHELIHTDPNPSCNPGKSNKALIHSLLLTTHNQTSSARTTISNNMHRPRTIPKWVHITGKTRCMTPKYIQNIQQWQFPGYSLLIHDDAAVDRLLNKEWPEFPHLQLIRTACSSTSGAAKADLWRYLVLWEYGGIYADMDAAPGPLFRQGRAIQDTDQAWFVIERGGFLSQYFMVAAPKHPFLHVLVMECLDRLFNVQNIATQYVPFVTGPGVVKAGFPKFLRDPQVVVKQGVFSGMDNATVTVKGRTGHGKDYVIREAVSGIHKKGGYAAMGMQHFGQAKSDKSRTHSCLEALVLLHQQHVQDEMKTKRVGL